MSETVHCARFLLARPDRLLRNAAVRVTSDGRVAQTDVRDALSASAGTRIIDWGDAIILPGLVNAHTHLELTALHRQLTRFTSFTDWALQLIRARRAWTPDDYRAGITRGAELALTSGTTLTGDISASGVGWNAGGGAGPRRVVFEETLGLAPELAAASLEKIKDLLARDKHTPTNRGQIHALSPHAPYSTSRELYRLVAAEAARRNIPWTTHLAETAGELQFFMTGEGEFRSFLLQLGALPAHWTPPRQHTVLWLDEIQVLSPRSLLAHCNYLDDASIYRIARAGAPVVYCPRSHAFFGHDNHPVRRLLDAGALVALGTDSLASNDSLSMMDEMRFLHSRRRDLTPEEIIGMATNNGAAALGFAGRLGQLEPGYQADMSIWALQHPIKEDHILEQILEGAGKWRATLIDGN